VQHGPKMFPTVANNAGPSGYSRIMQSARVATRPWWKAAHAAPRITHGPYQRAFNSYSPQKQQHSDPDARPSIYRTHGRALLKALTLAFLTYQVVYWTWLTLETEEIKDSKNREIRSLENEVRLLDEGRKSHRPSERAN